MISRGAVYTHDPIDLSGESWALAGNSFISAIAGYLSANNMFTLCTGLHASQTSVTS